MIKQKRKWKLLIKYLINNGINRFGKMAMMHRGIGKQISLLEKNN